MTRYHVAIGTVLVIGGLALGGCTTRAELALYQPDAPPAQRELQLKSEWAACAPQADRLAVLLQFPLPGALDGPRDYHLYLVVPNDGGTHEVGADVRGFLVQSVGARRGKTALVGGTVRLALVGMPPRPRSLRVALDTADGCRLLGEAMLEEQPATLRQFQRQFAGDVAALKSAAADRNDAVANGQSPPGSSSARSHSPKASSSIAGARDATAVAPSGDELELVPSATPPVTERELPSTEADEQDEPALRETPTRGEQ